MLRSVSALNCRQKPARIPYSCQDQFGTLLYAGKDWKDRELGRQSMILMAEKVMPRVNAATSRQSNAAG